jgi:cysteine sulfinate desulfinase/cysteine desulfurase-like protein
VFETMRRLISEAEGKAKRDEIITTEIEHPCVLNAAKYQGRNIQQHRYFRLRRGGGGSGKKTSPL